MVRSSIEGKVAAIASGLPDHFARVASLIVGRVLPLELLSDMVCLIGLWEWMYNDSGRCVVVLVLVFYG